MADGFWRIGKKLALSLVIFATVYFTVRFTWAPEYFRIVGCSMWPVISNGDYCISIHKYGEIKRGDVIVFDYGMIHLVKRVIGLPGDNIKITGGTVFVNNKPEFTQDIVLDRTLTSLEIYELTLLEDEYFVLGDNRIYALDSRMIGPVPKRAITEKIILVWHSLSPTRYTGAFNE